MCAIFGVVGNYDAVKASKALALLGHRGPDACNRVQETSLFLGHHRLAIVDSDSDFFQPMYKEGVYALFNGEIYNYKALRTQLAHYPFQSQGDSEVVLAAYLEWGEAFVDKVEGMFAIAIVTDKKVLLYRDRLGMKPLYYAQLNSEFIFASEIKALVSYACEPKIDKEAVQSSLLLQTTIAPKTMYEGIFALEAGMQLEYVKGTVTTKIYDDILPKKFSPDSKDTALATIETLLKQSIEKRIESEVPLGFLLSGGVDSSLLCAMAQDASPNPIETFTLGYDEFQRYDERDFARKVAKHIGSKHHEIIFGFEDFRQGILTTLEALDEPINDPASIPLYFLFERLGAGHQKKVMLSGEGSDELFMGYRPYKELLEIEQIGGLHKKSWLKNFLNAHYSPHREWEWHRRALNDELLFRSSAESFTAHQAKALFEKKEQLIDSDLLVAHLRRRYELQSSAFEKEDAKLWYRYCDLKVHQGEYFLKKLDRVSMAHGIEARAPFLDESLVKYVMALNPDYLLDDGRLKNLLKDVALKYLPEEIVERKKRGFSYPYIEWMERLDAWETMRSINKRVKAFDEQGLEKLISDAKRGRFKQHAFGLYYLLLWLQKHRIMA